MELVRAAFIEAIFIAAAGGQPMQSVAEIRALAGTGLQGDRYATGHGYYSPRDVRQVTFIQGEVLDHIHASTGLAIHQGQHRRNIVTRGLDLRKLPGHQLRIGDVLLAYDGPRPPCGYVERLTAKGMTRAPGEGPGISMKILTTGLLRAGDEIKVLVDTTAPPLRRLP